SRNNIPNIPTSPRRRRGHRGGRQRRPYRGAIPRRRRRESGAVRMTLPLLAQARAAGLTVRADGDRLLVRGPKRLGALMDSLLAQKPAILEALRLEDAASTHLVAAAVAVSPDAVALRQPMEWPPPGATPARPGPVVDYYGPTAPTVPCRCCDRTAYRRAGTGWVCGTCHPAPEPRRPVCCRQ